MFGNHLINLLVALVIVVLALLSVGTMVSAQQSVAGSAPNRTAALDWYFAHDHAILDGDNNVLSIVTYDGQSQSAPLDWYFAHDHAILDGDNVVSR